MPSRENPDARRSALDVGVIIGCALLIGFALRLYRLDAQSLWYDEAYSVQLARLDLVTLVRTTAADIHPPLYYVLLKLWMAVAGDTEFVVRYLSLACSVLAIPVTYRLAYRLLGGTVARHAVLLVALSPLYVHYAQETRMYSLIGLSTELAVYFWLRGIAEGGRRNWILYVIWAIVAVYSHLYSLLIIAFLNVFYVGRVALGARGSLRRMLRLDRQNVASQIAIAVLFAPWVPVALNRVKDYTSPGGASPIDWILTQTAIVFSLGHTVLGVLELPGHPGFDEHFRQAALWTSPLIGLAGLGVLAGWRNRIGNGTPGVDVVSARWRVLFVVTYLLLPLVALVALSSGQRAFLARYLFVASPAYYLLVAMGLSWLASTVRPRGFGLAAWVVVGVIWASALPNYYWQPEYARDDHRSAVTHIQRHAQPGDLVVLDADFEHVYLFYADKANKAMPWARFPTRIPPDDEETLRELARSIESYRRIWLVMWGDYFLDPQRIVQGWLDDHTMELDGRVYQGSVIVHEYLRESPVLPTRPRPERPLDAQLGGEIALLGYDHQFHAYAGEGRVNLGLYWQALTTPSTDYSVFAQLQNAAGQVVGAGDSQPVRGRMPTRHWQAGQVIRDNLDVWIHPGTPPGDFRLVVGLYDQTTGQRLSAGDRDNVDAGIIRLEHRTDDARRLGHYQSAEARFAEEIDLIGFNLARPAPDRLAFSLFWRARDLPTRRYTVFAHVVDESGRVVGQHDGEPGGGSYPTNTWEIGAIVRDDRVIDLPLDLDATRRYRVLVGLYSLESGARLPVRSNFPLSRSRDSFELTTLAR
jgi:mannosyltransferase